MRVAATPIDIADLGAPAPPERLPSVPEFGRTVIAAALARTNSSTTPVVVRVHDLPAGLRNESAGVATFAADTGADFVWTPISSATSEPDGSLAVTSSSHSRGEIVVTLAPSRTLARHGYLARTQVQLRQSSPAQPALVELHTNITTVQLQLPAGTQRTNPLQLVRVDDPLWLPMHYSATGLWLARGESQNILLGAGTYELRDPLSDEHRQSFTVPAPSPIVVIDSLVALAADHP